LSSISLPKRFGRFLGIHFLCTFTLAIQLSMPTVIMFTAVRKFCSIIWVGFIDEIIFIKFFVFFFVVNFGFFINEL
jgi:hypothetical protein